MYVGKTRSLPYPTLVEHLKGGPPERRFTLVSYGLSGKHQTWLERLARENILAYFKHL